MIRVVIVGGAGRMGQIMAAGLTEIHDVEVTTLVDVNEPLQLRGATWVTSIDEAKDVDADVVVDFSNAQGVASSLVWCAKHKKHLVIGASGIVPSELEAMDDKARAAKIGVLQAANFSIGAVLAERFAVQAAPYFDRVEIIEMHHDKKVDAPSGTCLLYTSAGEYASSGNDDEPRESREPRERREPRESRERRDDAAPRNSENAGQRSVASFEASFEAELADEIGDLGPGGPSFSENDGGERRRPRPRRR